MCTKGNGTNSVNPPVRCCSSRSASRRTAYSTEVASAQLITGSWFPTDWTWDLEHVLILFGIFAMAEWSACAWETAAIYGPEYKNPNTDTPGPDLAFLSL